MSSVGDGKVRLSASSKIEEAHNEKKFSLGPSASLGLTSAPTAPLPSTRLLQRPDFAVNANAIGLALSQLWSLCDMSLVLLQLWLGLIVMLWLTKRQYEWRI